MLYKNEPEELKPQNSTDDTILKFTSMYLEVEEQKSETGKLIPLIETPPMPPFEKIIKKKKLKKVPLVLVGVLLSIFLFSGAVYIKKFNFKITQYPTYTSFGKYNEEEQEILMKFHYLPTYLVKHFEQLTTFDENGVLILVFENMDNQTVLFCESDTEQELSYAVDTENAVLDEILLTNGVEAYLITKNSSTTLLWEQHGYFYMLFTENKEIDLIDIAISLEKNE